MNSNAPITVIYDGGDIQLLSNGEWVKEIDASGCTYVAGGTVYTTEDAVEDSYDKYSALEDIGKKYAKLLAEVEASRQNCCKK